MTRLFITGALGHIGSRFIHSIQPGQYEEVVLVDNMLVQRYCSLFNLPDGVPFRFIESDVCSVDLEPLFAGADVVLHLAAITNAAGSFEIQEEVEKVNYGGTERVAQACLKTGSRLIFLSTTSVYGTQDGVVDENCPAEQLKPQSPYASSKLSAESLLHELGASQGLQYATLRFGTIFGTSVGMRFHTAVNKFIWQACMGQPVTVWRTALHQKRPYLDVRDAVKAIEFVIEKDLFHGEIYNVLTLNATVNEICDAIRKSVPTLGIKLVDERIMNQLSYEVISQKIESLGFTYHGDLSSSVAETVSWLKNANPSSLLVS